MSDNINTARACPHCGYPINPGQPNHPCCVDDRIADLEEALWRIQQWAEAYPPTVFGDLTSADLHKAHETLKANGMTIDAISAHVGRHCLKGVGDIARGVLRRDEQQ